MDTPFKISTKVYHAMKKLDYEELNNCSNIELRPILPVLARMSHSEKQLDSVKKSAKYNSRQKLALSIVMRFESAHSLYTMLKLDFLILASDTMKEISLRSKVGNTQNDSVLISNLKFGASLEFEKSDSCRRLRLVLSELLAIMGQIQSSTKDSNEQSGTSSSFSMKQSELFDHLVYLSEVCDVLAIAMAELPVLLSPPEVAEALLRLKYGPAIICHIVVNQPDSFHDVVFHLLRNGEKQDEEGSNRIRQGAILMLCDMNPSETVTVRNKCIEWCKMPSLALHLTMAAHARQPSSDLVSFLSGLLLGSDPQIRSWISFFVRSGQKKRSGEEALNAYRKVLSAHLGELVVAMRGAGGRQQQETVVRACALLRL